MMIQLHMIFSWCMVYLKRPEVLLTGSDFPAAVFAVGGCPSASGVSTPRAHGKQRPGSMRSYDFYCLCQF